MGTGDRLSGVIDAVMESLDLRPGDRKELEDELAADPYRFGEKYKSFMDEEHRKLLGVSAPPPTDGA